MDIDKSTLLEAFGKMQLIRKFEDRFEDLTRDGRVPGTFHSSHGQEAIPSSVAVACKEGDMFVSNHRGHGHMLAVGGEPNLLAAEIAGRETGYCRGRGGTQHVAAFDVGFMGAMGITGGGIPLGTGLALASKYLKKGAIAVSFFGDGASSQGTFHESLNIAALKNLPVLYVVENNGYAMGTATAECVAGGEVHKRAIGYGMQHERVDGNNLAEMIQAAVRAVDYVRANSKPFLLEAMTYRLHGHSRTDKAPYRPDGELAIKQERDPIILTERYLIENNLATKQELEEIATKADERIELAVEFAVGSKLASKEDAATGVFATSLDELNDFNKVTINPEEPTEVMTGREAIAGVLHYALKSDPTTLIMGEDVAGYDGAFKVTKGMSEEFGTERVMDMPISENSIVGVATGAAMAGLRPIVEVMFMDFMYLAADQLINHAAKLRYLFGEQCSVPIILRTPAGGYRGYGATHSQSLQSLVMQAPGLRVLAPSTPHDAAGLLMAALKSDDPVVFIEHKLLYAQKGECPVNPTPLPIGKARMAREGKDITFIAHSYGVNLSLEVAEALAKKGVESEVLDLRSLKPLDWEGITTSARKCGRVVVVEEGAPVCGVTSELAAGIQERAFGYLDAPILRVTAKDCPIPTSPEAEREVLLSAADILNAATRLLNEDY